jgi:hypothetical protein
VIFRLNCRHEPKLVSFSGWNNSIAQKSKNDESSTTVPSTKVPSVNPRRTPKAAPDLPPAFQAMASYFHNNGRSFPVAPRMYILFGKRPQSNPRCRPIEEDDPSTLQCKSLRSRSAAPPLDRKSTLSLIYLEKDCPQSGNHNG